MKRAKKVIQMYSLIPDFKEEPTVQNMLRFWDMHLSVANIPVCSDHLNSSLLTWNKD